MFPPSLPFPASASHFPSYSFLSCPSVSVSSYFFSLVSVSFFLTSLLCVYIYLSVCLLVDFLLVFGSFFSVFFYLYIFRPQSPFLYPVCRLSIFPFSLSRFPPSCLPSSLSFPPPFVFTSPHFSYLLSVSPLFFLSTSHTFHIRSLSHFPVQPHLFFILLSPPFCPWLLPSPTSFYVSHLVHQSYILLRSSHCTSSLLLSRLLLPLPQRSWSPSFISYPSRIHSYARYSSKRSDRSCLPPAPYHSVTSSPLPPLRYSRPHSTASAIQKVSPKMCFCVVSLFLSTFPSSYLYLYFFSWWSNVYLCSHIYFFSFIFLLLSTHNKVTS